MWKFRTPMKCKIKGNDKVRAWHPNFLKNVWFSDFLSLRHEEPLKLLQSEKHHPEQHDWEIKCVTFLAGLNFLNDWTRAARNKRIFFVLFRFFFLSCKWLQICTCFHTPNVQTVCPKETFFMGGYRTSNGVRRVEKKYRKKKKFFRETKRLRHPGFPGGLPSKY